MKKPKRILCSAIVPRRGVSIGASIFWCSYCGKSWPRGGGREGFVKSAAMSHVAQCYHVLLFQAGYIQGDYIETKPGRMVRTGPGMAELRGHAGDYHALPISALGDEWRRVIRGLKAAVAKRRRDGLTPKVPR